MYAIRSYYGFRQRLAGHRRQGGILLQGRQKGFGGTQSIEAAAAGQPAVAALFGLGQWLGGDPQGLGQSGQPIGSAVLIVV